MGKGTPEAKYDFTRLCPKALLSSYPVLEPSYTSFTFKNFKSSVNFNMDLDDFAKSAFCKEGTKLNHVRNKQLFDLPLKVPKCCFDAYNANVARQKQKKLQKFGLSSPVTVPDCGRRPEEKVERVCEEDKVREFPAEKITVFPECYLLPDSDSEDEPEDEFKSCSSGSESDCSGCSTLGGGTRRKMHKVVKKDWRDFFHKEYDPCKKTVGDEIMKHKSKQFFDIKVKKLLEK